MHLKDDEAENLSGDLESILEYIALLQELDTADVQPTSHVLALKNVYRKDEIKPSLTQEETLSIAIAKHNGSFKVPQVIE